jgi:hypothetical protein
MTKLTKAQKEAARQADLERLSRETFENNHSLPARLPEPAQEGGPPPAEAFIATAPGAALAAPAGGGDADAKAPGEAQKAVLVSDRVAAAEGGSLARLGPFEHARGGSSGEAAPPVVPVPGSGKATTAKKGLPGPERPTKGVSGGASPPPLASTLLEGIKGYRRPEGAARVSIRVTAEVFSAVTACAFGCKVDKVAVTSCLLERCLPESEEETPEYLVREPKKAARDRDLTFFETPELSDRLNAVCSCFGVPKAYLVENLILRELPAAPRLYPPKRAVRGRR